MFVCLLCPFRNSLFVGFFPDGRHFKSVYGKDFVESLFTGTEVLLGELEKTAGEQFVSGQNRATSMQGQIDLLRSHQATQDLKINCAIAREAEDSDGRLNERFVCLVFWFRVSPFFCLEFFVFCFLSIGLWSMEL